MTKIRQIESEKPISRQTSFLRLLFIVALIIFSEFLGQFLKPNIFTGSSLEWVIITIMVIIVIVYLLLDKHFIKAKFDLDKGSLTIYYMTTIGGYKEHEIEFRNLKIQEAKEGSLRQRPTKTMNIKDQDKTIIKLVASYVGEETFDKIATEITLQGDRITRK